MLRCRQCAGTLPPLTRRVRCGACGGLLEIVASESGGQGPGTRAGLIRAFAERRLATLGPQSSGVWRYRELVYPDAADSEIASFPEGNTPLVSPEAVARWAGLDALLLKHEGMNPTGSFKDRGMTVGVTHARRVGVSTVACASTGNTAASMAAYAALAGLGAFVLVPAGKVAMGKLSQTLSYGARVVAVRGDFDACLTVVDQGAEELGLYLLNSINPFRLEGQKAIVFELLEQLGWEPPDWIALPAGNLGNTSAFGTALREAKSRGLIARVPRLAAIQAAGAAPFAQSFAAGFRTRYRVAAETVATAIRIGDPASFDRAVEAIRFTNGVVTAVGDGEILEAKRVIDAAGIGCEPASAASVAGVRRLVREGTIRPGERVAAVLTGHLLKDSDALAAGTEESGVEEVEPTLAAVARAL
jgi:threonine synthase